MRARLAVAIGLAALAATLPAHAYPRPGALEWVSARPQGVAGGLPSGVASISADGRHVVFQSALPLLPGDTNGTEDIFVRDLATGALERASVATDGGEGSGASVGAAISADGRHVVFHSLSGDLVPGDDNGILDVFLRDRLAGTTELVSVAADGGQANAISYFGVPSADARYVAFQSFASNLVPGDANGAIDIFVRDRLGGTTERVSVAPGGGDPDDGSATAAISDEGRYVAFQSVASNLVPGDANGAWDVFVHDRLEATTERVSVPTGGGEGDERSLAPRMSPDGRWVAFYSHASNLVPADRNGVEDVFVHDRLEGTTERVSVTSGGAEADLGSAVPAISADGRHVAFQSFATNLAPGDTNAETDIFVHDRAAGTTERVSVGAGGAQGAGRSQRPTIGADGSVVAFDSYAPDLVPGDGDPQVDVFVRDRGPATGVAGLEAERSGDAVTVTGRATFSGAEVTAAADPPGDGADALGAEIVGASVTYRPEHEDLLLRIRLASLPDAPVEAPGVVYRWGIVAGGSTFEVRAMAASATTVPPGGPAAALYACDDVCIEITALDGGVGVIGPEVRASVPLEALGSAEGDPIGDLVASVGPGEVATGPVTLLDDVALPGAAIPAARVELGAAPDEPASPAALEDGLFTGSLALPGGELAWARACLGEVCGASSVPVT